LQFSFQPFSTDFGSIGQNFDPLPLGVAVDPLALVFATIAVIARSDTVHLTIRKLANVLGSAGEQVDSGSIPAITGLALRCSNLCHQHQAKE
jgi:hypothetical protein